MRRGREPEGEEGPEEAWSQCQCARATSVVIVI